MRLSNATTLARIEDWVFFTTILGMDEFAAYYRACGMEGVCSRDMGRERDRAERAVQRWKVYLAANPHLARWHADPRPWPFWPVANGPTAEAYARELVAV